MFIRIFSIKLKMSNKYKKMEWTSKWTAIVNGEDLGRDGEKLQIQLPANRFSARQIVKLSKNLQNPIFKLAWDQNNKKLE